MNDDDQKKEDPSQGVKIQKLPTYGRPLSYRTWKQGYRPGIQIKVNSKHKKQLEQIVGVLSQKDKEDT